MIKIFKKKVDHSEVQKIANKIAIDINTYNGQCDEIEKQINKIRPSAANKRALPKVAIDNLNRKVVTLRNDYRCKRAARIELEAVLRSLKKIL